MVSTVAGQTGVTGFTNGIGSNATFSVPIDVDLDAAGTFTLVVSIARVAKQCLIGGIIHFTSVYPLNDFIILLCYYKRYRLTKITTQYDAPSYRRA